MLEEPERDCKKLVAIFECKYCFDYRHPAVFPNEFVAGRSPGL